jgi:hypothetical protein
MRWEQKRTPKDFEEKRIIRFAFFPVKVQDYCIWLESYSVLQQFDSRFQKWYDLTNSRKLIDKTK